MPWKISQELGGYVKFTNPAGDGGFLIPEEIKAADIQELMRKLDAAEYRREMSLDEWAALLNRGIISKEEFREALTMFADIPEPSEADLKQMSPNKSFSIEEVARVFGVPVDKVRACPPLLPASLSDEEIKELRITWDRLVARADPQPDCVIPACDSPPQPLD